MSKSKFDTLEYCTPLDIDKFFEYKDILFADELDKIYFSASLKENRKLTSDFEKAGAHFGYELEELKKNYITNLRKIIRNENDESLNTKIKAEKFEELKNIDTEYIKKKQQIILEFQQMVSYIL